MFPVPIETHFLFVALVPRTWKGEPKFCDQFVRLQLIAETLIALHSNDPVPSSSFFDNARSSIIKPTELINDCGINLMNTYVQKSDRVIDASNSGPLEFAYDFCIVNFRKMIAQNTTDNPPDIHLELEYCDPTADALKSVVDKYEPRVLVILAHRKESRFGKQDFNRCYCYPALA
jgi:hypothetical protein